MDNLTHSLVGALIGQMGLKRKTGLAMPTLIIAANIPDIDAVATLLGGHQHLAIRRGITHGPIALVLLPLLLWGIMLWFDRWQTKRGKRPEKRLPIHKGWLLALAYIGCLSHPLFDWFNSYGIRLLEPFSSQWFYGDTLFIIDVWLWLAFGLGLFFSLRLERHGTADWVRPARTVGILVAAYLSANFAISTAAENSADNLLRSNGVPEPRMVVANPVPIAFWEREILWRNGTGFGFGTYSLAKGVRFERAGRHSITAGRKLELESAVSDTKPFLFWSRMPVLMTDKGRVKLTDQRFSNELVADRFSVDLGSAQ
jgi:inner membrane protein